MSCRAGGRGVPPGAGPRILVVSRARTGSDALCRDKPCAPTGRLEPRASGRAHRGARRIPIPTAKVEHELHALLKSECFLAAAETERVPKPDSSESLKKWWMDGGHHWLASYLELRRLGSTSELAYIVVPPDTRRTLYLDSQRDSSARKPLVCEDGFVLRCHHERMAIAS